MDEQGPDKQDLSNFEGSIEGTPLEVEPIRRAASAQFVVDSDVGSAAALREAMDPANRSLTDALQMSFRMLQVVIIVLLILFVFSGFKTVGSTQSGVATVWGRIVDRDGLEPGLRMNWPPPIGEFVLFQSDGRTVDDMGVFIPQDMVLRGDQAVERASARDNLVPGRDGSFLTDGGELAHVRVSAEYSILDPVGFLNTIPDSQADAIVRVALERAVVHVGGSHTLHALQDDLSNEEIQELIGDSAQAVLNDIGSGIQITSVTLSEEIQPPMYIQRIQENFSQSRQTAEAKIERARQNAQDMLIGAAGDAYPELARLMRTYEELWEQDDVGADDQLSKINAFFDSEALAGQAALSISTAHRFQSLVDQTLGREARRFTGLLPAYRKHPELVIAEKWLHAYGSVLARQDVEILYVPQGLGSMGIDISGLESVRDIRRRADILARESAKGMLSGDSSDYMMRSDEIKLDQAQRQLSIDTRSGTVSGMRQELLNNDN
jgi:regulator of protease activity HflC (stomatin/prohibitin superfamily)